MTKERTTPLLLTPGPLTTSEQTKAAMLRDWGSRDSDFIDLNRRVCRRLLEIAGTSADTKQYHCVPIQGSGTFAVEASLDSLVPRDGKILLVINGAYGHRMKTICDYIGRSYEIYETPEDTPPDIGTIEQLLKKDTEITHVAAVHCETTSGIINPIEAIADCVRSNNKKLIIDAMSSFGGLDIDISVLRPEAIVASANKCLEGVPGFAFAIVDGESLNTCKGNATSLSLDLYGQWAGFEASGQWRFTPATHTIAALDCALDQFEEEGGIKGRRSRYTENKDSLIRGMQSLGFDVYLQNDLQSPVIVTFLSPNNSRYNFEKFYAGLYEKGFAIYPGKLTKVDSFRVGCIGQVFAEDIQAFVEAVAEVLQKQGIILQDFEEIIPG